MKIINPVFGTNRFSFARDAAVTPRRHAGERGELGKEERCHLRAVARISRYQNQVQSMVQMVHESL